MERNIWCSNSSEKKPIQEKSRGRGRGKPKKQQLIGGSLIKPEDLLPNDHLQNHLLLYPNRLNGWWISEEVDYKPVLSFSPLLAVETTWKVYYTNALHIHLLWPSDPILAFITHFFPKLELLTMHKIFSCKKPNKALWLEKKKTKIRSGFSACLWKSSYVLICIFRLLYAFQGLIPRDFLKAAH